MTTTTLPSPTADSSSIGSPRRHIPFAPLRAVIYKELRENLKYIVFLQLILGLLVAAIIWADTNGLHHSMHPDSALLSTSFEFLSFFACSAAAFIIAFAQVFSERPVDLRAFFIHRAITPSRLFLAKILSGLILYFLAVGIPILILILVSALSADAAWIFDIHFARPYLVDFATGFSFYSAGILLGQRQARLYASRLIPFAAALVTSLCSAAIPSFSSALLAVLLLDALLLLAAWNCYIHLGLDTSLGQTRLQTTAASALRPPSWFSALGRFSLPTVMALGLTAFLGFGLIAVLFGLMTWSESLPKSTAPYDNYGSYYDSLYDGTPIRVAYHYYTDLVDESKSINERSYFDLAGNPLPPAATQHAAATQVTSVEFGPHESPALFRFGTDSYRDSNTVLQLARSPADDPNLPPGSPNTLRWYYLPFSRYYVGTDPTTHRRISTLGATGLLPISSPPQPFAYNPLLIWGYAVQNNTLCRPDFATGRLNPQASFPPDEIPQNFKMGLNSQPNSPSWTIVITNKQIHFLNEIRQLEYKPLFALPIEHPLDQYTLSVAHRVDAHTFTVSYAPAPSDKPATSYLTLYNETGELLHRYELPPLPEAPLHLRQPAIPYFVFAAGIIDSFRNPLLSHAVVHNLPDDLRREVDNTPDTLFTNYRFTSSVLAKYYYAGVVLSFLLSALLVLRLTRRYRFTLLGTILWPLATLLLGPIGLLTFLFTQPLPARIRCPTCHRKRLVTRSLCEHCRAPFPPPPTTGTEILAPVGVPA